MNSLLSPRLQICTTPYNWHIPSGCVNNCWNCNGDHGVNKCKLPKSQARMVANKMKWEEEKKKTSGSGSGGSGSGEGPYERSKFGNRTENQKPSGGSVDKFNNVWHMYCSKGCGLNCTHTCSFHSAFTSNALSFPSTLPAPPPPPSVPFCRSSFHWSKSQQQWLDLD